VADEEEDVDVMAVGIVVVEGSPGVVVAVSGLAVM